MVRSDSLKNRRRYGSWVPWTLSGLLTVTLMICGERAIGGDAHYRPIPAEYRNALDQIRSHAGKTRFQAVYQDWDWEEGHLPKKDGWTSREILLGPEWTGGNDGLSNLRDIGAVYELTLDSPEITEGGIAHLSGLRYLNAIHFKRTPITDAGLRYLKGIAGLQVLSLDGEHLTDAGLDAVKDHRLMWLLIENRSQLTDAGLAHLADMTCLMRLQLAGDKITGSGLASLAALKDLRTLELAKTAIDDAGLDHLPNLPHLSSLDLSRTHVRGPGLVALQRLPQLRQLRLDGCMVTDESLPHLVELQHLIALSLKDTSVTPSGIETLRHQTKRLKVVLSNTTHPEVNLGLLSVSTGRIGKGHVL